MAIANVDGSIVLTTKVDQSGLKKGMTTMKSEVSSLAGSFGKLAKAIGVAFSVNAIINFSKEASNLATKTEASVQRLIDIYGEASKAVGDFIDANANALGMSRTAAASYASVYGNLFSVWAEQRTNAELTTAYLNMTAVVASKTGRTVADVQERIRSGLLGNTEAIEDLGIFVNVKTIEMTEAFKRMANGRSWEQLDAYTQQQIRSMAILEQATSKYGNEATQGIALTRAQFKAAYEEFKATWGEVINRVLLPVMEALAKVFALSTAVMQSLFNISSVTIKQTTATEAATSQQNKLTDAVKETEKAARKAVAPFDEIQILTEESSEDFSNVGMGGEGGYALQLTPVVEQVEEFEKVTDNVVDKWEEFATEVVGKLTVSNLLNVQNATLKVQETIKKNKELLGDWDVDWADIAAGFGDMQSDATTSVLTTFAGILDMTRGWVDKDGSTWWQGLGELIGGYFQAPFAQWAYDVFYGEGAAKEMFMPVTEYVENLYRDLSVKAAAALEEYQKEVTEAKTELMKIMFWDTLITETDVESIDKSIGEAFDVVKRRTKEVKEEAYLEMTELIEKGLITEEEAKAALDKAEIVYEEQTERLEAAQEEITSILTKAKNEQRALTQEEEKEISRILKEASDENVSIIKAGAGDREEILRILNEREHAMSSTRLSQVIQFANSEYRARVDEANKTYDETIASAEKLYKELGVISEDQYLDMVNKAKKTREEQVLEAQQARTELVNEALGTAGEIATTVDPETGVILSTWEILWNRMYYVLLNTYRSIALKINEMLATIGNSINNFIVQYNDLLDWMPEWMHTDLPTWDVWQLPLPDVSQGIVTPTGSGTGTAAPIGEGMTEAIIKALNIAAESRMGESSGGAAEIVLEIDGREFGRAVVDYGDMENRRIGTRLVIA